MEKVKSRMEIDEKVINIETSAEMVTFSDTTLKAKFDEYSPLEMSEIGKKLIKSKSVADLCRILHLNYSFVKDIIDDQLWTVVGNPEVENKKLHVSNGNRIWRSFALGAYDIECEIDLSCAEPGKVIFQFFDNMPSTSTSNYQHFVRLSTNSEGKGIFTYQYRKCETSTTWGAMKTGWTIELGDISEEQKVKITFSKDSGLWTVYLNGEEKGNSTYAMSTRTWQVWLGNNADALIDNFTLKYNSNLISELDFD